MFGELSDENKAIAYAGMTAGYMLGRNSTVRTWYRESAYAQVADEMTAQVAQLEGCDVVIIGGLQAYFNPIYTAMQSNPATMEFLMPVPDRAASDAVADRAEDHFARHGFGLWVAEVPGAMCASKALIARSRSSWVPGVAARPSSSNCSLRMRM